MSRHALRACLLALFAGTLLAACGGGSGSEPIVPAGPPRLVDTGRPEIAPASGFAGSATCRACHPAVFDDWAVTAHNTYVRTTDRPGPTGQAIVADANGNGTDDFRDGLDLATDPDFASYGANAPRLLYVAGDALPVKVRIGAVTFDVWRTVGGNGEWKQQYLTRIGRAVHVLPIQYDERSANRVPYRPEDWYAGFVPRVTSAATAAATLDPADSWDLQCAGCHTTALQVKFEGDQYVTGYTDLTIGCESCHGPAQAHVNAGGDPALVLNPADLLDGSVAGVQAATMLCARCHVRGAGDVPTGGAHAAGYPWKTGGSTFPPGATDLDGYVTLTTSTTDLWRYKDNPLGFAPTPADPSDDTYLAARTNHAQANDLLAGPHAPDRPYDSNCFDCHDPHRREQGAQLRRTLTEGGVEFTGITAANNKLCLACHHGHGDFGAVTSADVQAIADAGAPAAVAEAVVDHMKNRAAMPVDASAYDPTGEGTGRCTDCHMVRTALSAAYTTDRAGNNVGDIHGHTFEPVWPNLSELTSPRITNSCNVCHPLPGGDRTGDIISEWATDADDDGTFHADTPANFQNGVANPERDGGVACAACHTTDGFLAIQVENGDIHHLADPGSADARTGFVRTALAHDKGITCAACHGKRPGGDYATGENPLRFPVTELCGRCHNNETVRFEDYRDHGEIVRHPQQQMFLGVEGGQVPGVTYENSPHTTFVGKACVGCHMNEARGGNHRFEVTVNQCQPCHPGAVTFDFPLGKDFDGDGTVEGVQTEFDGCLKRLEDAILAAPTSTGAVVTWEDPYWLVDGEESNTAALNPNDDQPLIRAMFNHYWTRFDESRGVHNTAYAFRLIQSSWEKLTGSTWPGVKR